MFRFSIESVISLLLFLFESVFHIFIIENDFLGEIEIPVIVFEFSAEAVNFSVTVCKERSNHV